MGCRSEVLSYSAMYYEKTQSVRTRMSIRSLEIFTRASSELLVFITVQGRKMTREFSED